ncbi:MarR family winged helix-turn-helix transcriptional regulator [Kineococcus arenarius]|uniref:MarR family winged helix-turn-helix transcriptional regulator n=1 Tax=unclassified Kineococcus TaxID=2621656 RepID=UPI003D7C6B51
MPEQPDGAPGAPGTAMRRFAADDVWGGLSLREYDVLHTLSRCPTGRTRLGELSEQVHLPQPSLSRLVDRLERRGLLARETDPADRRGVVVALTEDGAQRQREVGGRHAAAIAPGTWATWAPVSCTS